MSEAMVQRYTANDFAPTYEFEVDEDGQFLRLLHVWSFDIAYWERGTGEKPSDLLGPAHFEEYIRAAWPLSWLARAQYPHTFSPRS